MEIYAYYSIVFFGGIIILLYCYLLYEKIKQLIIARRKAKYIKELSKAMDTIITNAVNCNRNNRKNNIFIRKYMKKNLIREVFEDKVLHCMESSAPENLPSYIKLCEELGFVDNKIKELLGSDKFEIALACKRLGEFKSKKAALPLVKVLNSLSSDIIYNALMALSKIGDEASFLKGFLQMKDRLFLSERSLIEIVDNFEGDKHTIFTNMIASDNEQLAVIFIKSAGNNRDASLKNEISKYLFDISKEKRIASLKALGNIGDYESLEKIIKLLQDEEWEVRAVAATALEAIKDKKSIKPLVKALSDTQWFVRYNAAKTLLSIPGGLFASFEVFKGRDKFAKDIVISAMEKYGYMETIEVYDGDVDIDKVRMAKLVKDYIGR